MKFCDCNADGFCHRYQREMVGRMREICAGVNVDLGTAAAFREVWRRESGASNSMQTSTSAPTPLLLKTDQAPGDAVAMTAAIYSLHRAHPTKYVTMVDSPYPEVFAHNPDVASTTSFPNASVSMLQMHYPAIHQSNDRGIHFMQGWCEFLGAALGIDVPLLTNRPHLYFNDRPAPIEDYWVVCSGGKRDFTNKLWGHYNYQEVVNLLPGITFVQVGGNGPEDIHQRLWGTVDAIGKTSLRQLFDLVRRARGVVCGVSLLMHVAAALEKPAIVIAGGREPVAWNAYPNQQYLHTVGATPCCDSQGRAGACWRSRLVPLGDDMQLDKDTCMYPVNANVELINKPPAFTPKCMSMIEPREVVRLILRYNERYEHPSYCK
jgi:ADP-heptose:LPS heptosyltransferase